MKMSNHEHPVLEKVFEGLSYISADSLNERSGLSQDIGRIVDRAIGVIIQNPCRGCDVFYEEVNGKRRADKDADVIPCIDFDERAFVREAIVSSCKESLVNSLNGTARFEACETRLDAGFVGTELF